MIKFIMGLILGLVCFVFFFQNRGIISVSFINWSLSLPIYLLMLIFFVSGSFLGWLLTSLGFLKKRKRNKKE